MGCHEFYRTEDEFIKYISLMEEEFKDALKPIVTKFLEKKLNEAKVKYPISFEKIVDNFESMILFCDMCPESIKYEHRENIRILLGNE